MRLRPAFHRHALPGSPWHRLAAAALGVALTGSFALGITSHAQDDGTGASPLPGPTDCVLVPARAEVVMPGESASPAASPALEPVASPVIAPLASPAASPVASPVLDVMATPEASPVATDPNAAVVEEIEQAITAIFGCLNERNFDQYAVLTSDALRGQLFGSAEPLPADLFVGLAETLPPITYRVAELGPLEVVDATTVQVDVTYIAAWQLKHGTWTFAQERVEGVPAWVLDRETPLPVTAPSGAATIAVTFGEASYTLAPEGASGPDVVLQLQNPTGADHEALVVRLDEGVPASVLLQGGNGFPEGVTFVGQATVLAGGSGSLVLTGLEPGTYTLVDLLPDAAGLPNLSSGMVATFTVD